MATNMVGKETTSILVSNKTRQASSLAKATALGPPLLSSDIPKLSPILHEDDHFPGRVLVLYKMKVLRNIKKYLSSEDLQEFKESCVGHLLELPDLLETSRQLMNFLIMRQAKTMKAKETWFDIYEQPARFSRYEFVMINGLNCRTFSNSREVDMLKCSNSREVDMLKCKKRLKVDYFGDEKITIDELERIFIEMKYSKGKFKKKLYYININHDHLRVALIYCVEGVILL
ncbi:hypothetical protein PanWU01x14_080740 [Parasponia andersonii]|uniref:DUF1985 domain-containing protein n=1 Tax=Parasponia andersonii TaxID=3476 RepID=A0A2P5DAT3_PARAD|nr:hypothetical protein PanWU01x14_080740 [Parasponia andersonii]